MRGLRRALPALQQQQLLMVLGLPLCTIITPRSSRPCPSRAMATATTAQAQAQLQEQKKALRSRVRKALRALSPDRRALQDSAIQSAVLSAPWFLSSRRLCAYISCPALREVDTSAILSHLLANPQPPLSEHQLHKDLYVPRVEDNNSNMRMLKITSMDDLLPNSMNILEPSPLDHNGMHRQDVMAASHPIDLFLLPGLAFDKQGRRLGRGGGYYDVLLKKYRDLAQEKKWNKPLLVALAYSEQIMEEGVIPITATDMPIDALVSSDGVTLISALAKEKMS